ncbi:MAG TPA: N-acetylglucosamine-6-phosphate deacetylase [Trueperaceae bacterium]
MRLALIGGTLATPHRLFEGYLLVENGVIGAVGKGDPPPELLVEARVVDLNGALAAPGFIDSHVHGGGGADVMDASPEALAAVAAAHAAGGITSFLPTTVAVPLEQLEPVFAAYRSFVAANGGRAGAQPLGLHLEGPFLNPEQSGALDPRSMSAPAEAEIELLLRPENGVRRMTVAPELPGGMALGLELRGRGMVASIGHSAVRGEELLEALDHGYELITHFYSGMEGVTRENAYRVAGLVEGGYLHDPLWVEVIADGRHLPAELLRLIYKVKGPSRIVLTTDAMRAAGLGPGEYSLGSGSASRRVLVEDGVAKLPDRSAFAGSVALGHDLVRTMVRTAQVPLLEALQMFTVNPARLLGIDHRKGRLVHGADADIVVLDEDLKASMTIVGGRIVAGGSGDGATDAGKE